MRFVALISGGKDSVYSVIECERFGHELVCCGNLHPADACVEEVDSWMYQSAAHSVVPAVAECLGVPLVRCSIRGSAVCRDLNYTASEEDEVEDLMRLLRIVLEKFPQVEAVSCGAVLSTYQRTRVEDVCARLGLVSLAYLWQRDQRELLNEMALTLEALVVKTASMGLEPGEHLGRTVNELKEEFVELHEKFGFHECGEGGEYETLVVDCSRFRGKRVSLDQVEKVTLEEAPRGCGAVGILRVDRWHVEESSRFDSRDDTPPAIPSPPLVPAASDWPLFKTVPSSTYSPLPTSSGSPKRTGHRSSSQVSCGLISTCAVSSSGEGAVAFAMERIRTTLAGDGLSFGDCIYAHLYVSDMSSFKKSNQAYVQALGERLRLVPSRTCVGLSSSSDCGVVSVDVDALAPGLKRSALNVRSISRWAPVCIGPYCQANVVADSIVFVAGQIALDPPTMLLDKTTHDGEIQTCLRHCDSILKACSSSLENVASFVVYAVDDEILSDALALLSDRVVVPVIVRELPRAARVEIQVIGVTRAAAPLFTRVDLSYAREGVTCSISASVANRTACLASLTLHHHHHQDDDDVEKLAQVLVDACVYLLKDVAGLRFEHWSRLRAFVASGEARQLQSGIETSLNRYATSQHNNLRGPAISVIPVVRGGGGAASVVAAAHLLAFDFRKFDAERWIAGGGTSS